MYFSIKKYFKKQQNNIRVINVRRYNSALYHCNGLGSMFFCCVGPSG